MQINFTRQQLDYLIQEANKQSTTIERVIQQLVDIQIDMQEALENEFHEIEQDLTLDMWNVSE